MNKIGSLYQVKRLYWLVFPNKESAVATATGATATAAYLSKQLNCNVTYFSPNDLFVLLEVDGIYKKILSTDGTLGWTWFEDMFNDCFEEVRAE